MARRLALLIGNQEFSSKESFPDLRTPKNDVLDLADILQRYGGFDILPEQVLVNETAEKIRWAIEEFFSGVERGDLVLLYYSGHGYRDQNGRHYLISRGSLPKRLLTTAISDTFIHDAMKSSCSRHRVIILDCCFSGAFIANSKGAMGSVQPLSLENLQGEATAILASSSKVQLSFEENGRNSLFTSFLIEGITSGLADEDGDGEITIEDIFYYAEKKVRYERPEQTPVVLINSRESRIIIAQNPTRKLLSDSHAYRVNDAYHDAEEKLNKAIEIFDRLGDKVGLIDALSEKGALLRQQRKYGKALDCYEQSISLTHEVGETHKELENLLNIALLYYETERRKEALTYAQRAVELSKQVQSYLGQIKAYQILANLLLEGEEYDSAFAAAQNACTLALFPKQNNAYDNLVDESYQNDLLDWLKEIILKLPSHKLARSKVELLLRLCNDNNDKLSGFRLKFVTRLTTLARDYPILVNEC